MMVLRFDILNEIYGICWWHDIWEKHRMRHDIVRGMEREKRSMRYGTLAVWDDGTIS